MSPASDVGSGGEGRPADRGLARERTELAWNRSGLAVVACVAVLLRRLWPLRGTGELVALACISAGAALWGTSLWIGRSVSARSVEPRLPLSDGRGLVITVATVVLAAGAFVLALFPAH